MSRLSSLGKLVHSGYYFSLTNGHIDIFKQQIIKYFFVDTGVFNSTVIPVGQTFSISTYSVCHWH